jgi:hypothetical protein
LSFPGGRGGTRSLGLTSRLSFAFAGGLSTGSLSCTHGFGLAGGLSCTSCLSLAGRLSCARCLSLTGRLSLTG